MKCDACNNKSICKYVEEMQSSESEIKLIKTTNLSPIKIEIKCNMYTTNNASTPFVNRMPSPTYKNNI